MRRVQFEHLAYDHFIEWETSDKKIFRKIAELVAESRRTPFKGKGKPEPLKGNLKGCWSRRITQEHRLVYKVEDELIIVVSCRFHYS